MGDIPQPTLPIFQLLEGQMDRSKIGRKTRTPRPHWRLSAARWLDMTMIRGVLKPSIGADPNDAAPIDTRGTAAQ